MMRKRLNPRLGFHNFLHPLSIENGDSFSNSMLIYFILRVALRRGRDQIVECGVIRYVRVEGRGDLVVFQKGLKLRFLFVREDLSVEGDLERHGSYRLRRRKGFLDECLLDRGTSSLGFLTI